MCLTPCLQLWDPSRNILTHINEIMPLLCPLSFKKIFTFIYLAAPGLSCNKWDLVSWPETKPRPPALGAWSLSHWTTREVFASSLWVCSSHSLWVWLLIERSPSLFWKAPPSVYKAAAAAAAKLLQSCPTLCDPIDGSPPGSPVPGILQARTLEWVAISCKAAQGNAGFVRFGVYLIWETLTERITKSEEARREGRRGLEAETLLGVH